jgi:hypothetical protein
MPKSSAKHRGTSSTNVGVVAIYFWFIVLSGFIRVYQGVITTQFTARKDSKTNSV